MATVNASAAGSNTGLGWRTERSTLLWLTKECQTSHCNATSNWVLECDTDTARTGGSWSERLADDRSNCERCMVTCHTDCRQHEWWPTPESPGNCFSLAALHARRCGNIVSKLQFATRQLYPLSTTVMPEQLGALWRSSLALPLEEMLSPLGRLLRACVLPTQVNCTYGVHCCGHSRCTALNRLYFGQCWTTGALEGDVTLNGSESGFDILLLFTARELIEPLQTELNC